mmetsp:Transcript_16377/g.41621  ORF Transcript_16377/g.41621 Transcript_16377/m.41621 type:complete len:224 (+) Transcript_16377:1164-1835(+)
MQMSTQARRTKMMMARICTPSVRCLLVVPAGGQRMPGFMQFSARCVPRIDSFSTAPTSWGRRERVPAAPQRPQLSARWSSRMVVDSASSDGGSGPYRWFRLRSRTARQRSAESSGGRPPWKPLSARFRTRRARKDDRSDGKRPVRWFIARLRPSREAGRWEACRRPLRPLSLRSRARSESSRERSAGSSDSSRCCPGSRTSVTAHPSHAIPSNAHGSKGALRR